MGEKYTYQYGTGTKKKDSKIVVNDLRIIQAQRTKQSIERWRMSHKAAEAISAPNRSRLYDLYDDVLLDGHLTGIVSKRFNTILNKRLEYLDAAGKKVDAMDALIESSLFRELKSTILETVLWGVSAVEFMPGKDFSFAPIPRKHIKPETGIIALDQNGTEGVSYNDLPFVWVMHDKPSAAFNPIRSANMSLGLLLSCAPYVIYKRDTMGDWAQYIEIFGQPVRVIKYDGTDEQTKIELKEILDESGNGLALLIPEQANFEMHDGKQSNGTGELQSRFIDAMNAELSILILGNTETTGSGKTGSLAKSKVHQEQQNEISKADIEYLQSLLNDAKFMAILASYGYPVVKGGRFQFKQQLDIDYLSERITIDKELANIIDIDPAYWNETYGVPMAKKQSEPDETDPENQPTPPAKKGNGKNAPAQEPDKMSRKRHLLNALKYFFG